VTTVKRAAPSAAPPASVAPIEQLDIRLQR
jgi:hypothetical protein